MPSPLFKISSLPGLERPNYKLTVEFAVYKTNPVSPGWDWRGGGRGIFTSLVVAYYSKIPHSPTPNFSFITPKHRKYHHGNQKFCLFTVILQRCIYKPYTQFYRIKGGGGSGRPPPPPPTIIFER